MQDNHISKKLLSRLPVYLDCLKSMPDSIENVSATMIANALDMGEVQVRKDLAKVSDTGRRKTGRPRKQLIRDIETFLENVSETGAILVGAGKLGQALLNYSGFEGTGIHLMAAFDICPYAERSITGIPIYPMTRLETFCKHYAVHLGIIAVPAEKAQTVCDSLVASGVKAILNFAPVTLQVPDHVVVHSENLAVSLATLHMQLKNKQSAE